MLDSFLQTTKKILVVVALLLIASSVDAKTWYVDAAAPVGGDGESWATAFRDIQSAVNAANPAWIMCLAPLDTIRVKEGTYNIASTITVDKVVYILGGYDSVTGVRDWNANPTIINGSNLRRCMRITTLCHISGFTIRDGNAVAGSGGGIFIDNALVYGTTCDQYFSPNISHCKFISNSAGNWGGGMYVVGSNPTITDCTFSENEADSGGGIYSMDSSLVVEKSIFHHNDSTAAGSLGGGAIAANDCNPTTEGLTYYRNCLFYNNTSNSWGGAISSTQAFPRIQYCTFHNNSADISGGAYHCNINSDAPFVYNSIFWANTPDQLDVTTSNPNWYVRYSDVQGGWTGPGFGNINDNPDFVGGADFHLTATSPCIDTAAALTTPTDDLEGVGRPIDGNHDGDPRPDMGCYEYAFSDLVITEIHTDPATLIQGQPFSITVTVHNQGAKDASIFYIDWYANRATPPPSGLVGNLRENVPDGLPAGADYIMSRTYTYAAEGDYQMWAQVDTAQEVAEGNEANNILGPQAISVIQMDPPVIDNATYNSCISELWKAPIQITAHDPEAGTLTYDWTATNGGSINGTGASVLFDPPDAGHHPCPYIIRVRVTSSASGLSTTREIHIYVKLAGDVNGDGVVNILDKVAVRNAFGQTGKPGWNPADVNYDGVVNILDKVIVRNQFGQTGCDCR